MDIDRDAAARAWRAFADQAGIDGEPVDVFAFGDSPELADELLALVLDGPKRATAGAVAEYELEGVDIPQVGDHSVVCDGAGVPRAIIRTTDVRVGPLSSVDDRFAWDEGEGDRTLEFWLDAHTRFFRRTHEQLGLDFGPDILVVFERFDLVARL